MWTYDLRGSTPAAIAKTRIGRPLDGSGVVGGALPSALAVSPNGHELAVTSSNDDLVEVLDTTRTLTDAATGASAHPRRVIDVRAVTSGPTGAQPDAVTWADGGRLLLIAEGGRNSIAVVDPTRLRAGFAAPGDSVPDGWNASAVLGRLPTGWYPTTLDLGADGRLWITNNMGLGSGPNTKDGAEGPAAPAPAATSPTLHTSFSSMVKTVNLILGLPPTSIGEMTATSMSDFFVSRGGRPDFSPYLAHPNDAFPEVNPAVAAAPNDAARQAGQLALIMPPGIDRAGELLAVDLALGREGALEARDPNVVALPPVVEHTLPDGSPPSAAH